MITLKPVCRTGRIIFLLPLFLLQILAVYLLALGLIGLEQWRGFYAKARRGLKR